MKRRDFLVLLAAGLLQPTTVLAQQPARKRVVAIMPIYTTFSSRTVLFAFLQRMAERGWEQGRNITYEFQLAANETQAVTEALAGLTRETIDVLVVLTLQMAFAARALIPNVPIVVVAAGDPVGAGAAVSLARPGGSITGMSLMAPELAAKRVEQLIELRPQARRIAILHNPDAAPVAPLMLESVARAASVLGVTPRVFATSKSDDFDPVFGAIADWNADGVVVLDDSVLFIERAALAAAAARRNLPLACSFREMARAGCLFSYSASVSERFLRSADYIDKILRGASPADLPFEQPSKFELVINLQTAKALGISVPETLLATADEVIE